MRPIATVLFDLDGTLTDPAEGITRSIQEALRQLDQPVPPTAELLHAIGPPLRQTFAAMLHTDDPVRIEHAMTLYRGRFATLGLYENTLYPGVTALLAAFQQRAIPVFIATSKPRVFAERISAHFALDSYLTGIYGSELDGRYDHKVELLGHLLATEGIDPTTTVMIGDREHDILAATHHGMRSIGVTYGYGSQAELTAAGATWLCDSPAAILACLDID